MISNEFSDKITVHCPICKRLGQIGIDRDIIERSDSGLTAVNVLENVICQHSFITYVDKNFNTRDCFAIDFKINIPQIYSLDGEEFDNPLNFDISIIRINLMPSILSRIIKAVLIGVKIVFISDQEFLNDHYKNFLEYIFGATFNLDLIFLTRSDYRKTKKRYIEDIVIDGSKVLRDDKKILEQSKLKIEQAIIQQFYNEHDEVSSIILLKNEFEKIEQFIFHILKHYKTQKKDQPFIIKNTISYLEKIYRITLPIPYLNFLLDIIESYFSIDLNRPNRIANFLGLI